MAIGMNACDEQDTECISFALQPASYHTYVYFRTHAAPHCKLQIAFATQLPTAFTLIYTFKIIIIIMLQGPLQTQ
jgi:hypothetical protein